MDAIDEKQGAEFESLLEELRKQLLDACVHFDIWEQLFPTAQVVDVLNQYRGFFIPTIKAHVDCFFIKVSNVVSNDPRSPSFYRIFKMLDNNPALAPGVDIRSLRKRLKQHKEVLKRIKKYRDTKGAHWDTQEQAQRKPVLFGDSKRMLKEFQDIFNKISSAHSGNIWSFKYSQQSNTTSLLNALKLWKQQNPLVNPARKVKMGKKEELSKEQAKWMVRVQELENRRKELEPQGAKVDYGEETKPWVYTPEKMAEIDRVDKELEEAKAKLKETEEKLRELPPS